jgi:predicted O-methyltransferase YrrM|tara:strand:- start:1741 stop:2466 length:726 start_codon:yes stop_codon:yes gene_type:complete
MDNVFSNVAAQKRTRDVCESVAKSMLGHDDPNFKRIHHSGHHILLYIKDHIMKEKCRAYFEIGTHFGHSLSTLLHSNYPSDFMSVDLFQVGGTISSECNISNVEQLANSNADKYNRNGYNFKIIKGNSHSTSTLEQVKSFLPNGIDLLFIDGDHNYGAVVKDFNLYYPLVNEGGFIVFDDYLPYVWKGNERTCPKAVNHLVSQYKDNLNVYGLIDDVAGCCEYKMIDPQKNTTFIVQKVNK